MTVADFGAALSFEWYKIRTLRSTFWNLSAFLAVSLALAVPSGWYLHKTYTELDAAERAAFDPIGSGLSSVRLGLLALVIFGVLTVTTEYTSGTIRSSLAAVPRRGTFFASKVAAGSLVALAASTVVVIATFAATQVMLGEHAVSLSDDGVLRAIVGGIVYTTLLCVFAMGLAAVLRSSALTIGLLFPLFFMISTILTSIPKVGQVAQFLPDVAGGQILYREPQGDTILNGWTGLAVLVAWTVAALAAGYLAVRRRDA
ncbi:ABC transporter permease subunit [Actinoplanes sichuanensis]|uniref:ABC transporter permease subunit n=1 Tax=Actinoplanes sichuanensis TaxID=512349 RepID=UPI0029556D7B|nr:ABC transporter permease subunit [Actinoplanes sichuanensis]